MITDVAGIAHDLMIVDEIIARVMPGPISECHSSAVASSTPIILMIAG